ncbi:MAG: hypothetical protein VYB38_00755 [Bacteroidota bacterium]|nr:hypothetical protein [Bacteroidota bacterium]MEC8683009.1 hypothetical protein [Bacteroidota bacterium]MEE3147688.1 hypothetical protein [Bacteroidota bacterium]MEE3243841.1 hypothetical protein [Bacteroidota bacterium]
MRRDFLSGLALGILVGLIIGLSIAQVTGIILGALTSLLAAFFGLRPDKEGESGNKIIIGSFSLGCFTALLLGIFLRTHDVLAPSLQNEIALYKSVNFLDEEIKELIYFKHFGLVANQKLSFNKEAANANALKSTLLMADENDLALCAVELEDLSLREIEELFLASGGKFQRLFDQLQQNSMDDSELKSSALLIKELLCE